MSGGTIYALTQMSYDTLGPARLRRAADEPGDFASILPSACTLHAPRAASRPRPIVKHDLRRRRPGDAGQDRARHARRGGRGHRRPTPTTAWSRTSPTARTTRPTYVYDGHDRLARPAIRADQGRRGTSSSSATIEQVGYDAAGNVTYGVTNRAGETIVLQLRRARSADPEEPARRRARRQLRLRPARPADLGRRTRRTTLTFTLDALGRRLSQTGPHGTMSYGLRPRRPAHAAHLSRTASSSTTTISSPAR